MSLIDKTYFISSINIPESKYSNLQAYIDRYEKEVLVKLLGYELAKEVLAYDADTSRQPIIDLVEGKDYTNNAGELVRWNGLLNTEKLSLISQYVYYFWVRDNQTFVGTVGTLQSVPENAQQASAAQIVSTAWVTLGTLYLDAYSFLEMFKEDYPTWVFRKIGSINSFDL